MCLSTYDTPSSARAAIRHYRHDVDAYEHPRTPPSSIPPPVLTTSLPGAVAYYVNFATSGYESVTIARGAIIAQLDVTCRPTGEEFGLAMQFAQQQLKLLPEWSHPRYAFWRAPKKAWRRTEPSIAPVSVGFQDC